MLFITSFISIPIIYVKSMDRIKTFCEHSSSFLCHKRIQIINIPGQADKSAGILYQYKPSCHTEFFCVEYIYSVTTGLNV